LIDGINDDPGEVRWLLYQKRTGKDRLRWHAWRAGERESACRHLKTGALVGKIVERRVERPKETPEEAPVCRSCVRRLGLSRPEQPAAQAQRPTPPASRKHTKEATCACDDCREARKAGARRYVDELEGLIEADTCPCVRRAVVDETQWELGEMTAILHEAERRLTHRLMLWEVTGDRAIAQDAGEVRVIVLDAWKAIARNFSGGRDGP
jgi:hypothetical protein